MFSSLSILPWRTCVAPYTASLGSRVIEPVLLSCPCYFILCELRETRRRQQTGHANFAAKIDMVHGAPASVEERTAKGTIAVFDVTATQAFLSMAPGLMAGKSLGCLEGLPAFVTGPRRHP